MTEQVTVREQDLLDEVRQWLSENWTKEIAEELRQENVYWETSAARKAWLGNVVEARWAVPSWPEAWHGRGLDNDQAKLIEREFARVKAPGAGQDRNNLWANTLLARGQEALKQQLIAPLLRSEVNM